MKKCIISCCFLLLAVGLQAQSKWSLRQCIDYAIDNNIEIAQQYLTVKSSEVDLSTSKNSRLPNLMGNAGQNFNFGRTQSQTTGIYEANSASTTSFGLSSSTPLFTGFRIPNEIKMYELNLLAAAEGLKRAKENLELQVTSLYLEVLFKKEILKVYSEQIKLSKTQVERTQLLVDAGKVPTSQLYDIKAQLAKDELNATMADNDLVLATLNLAQALNFLDIKDFDVLEPVMGDVIGDNISSIIPADQIFKIAVATRPHVKEAEYKVESSKRNLKVAQSGYWPTIDFGLSYNNGFDHIYKSGVDNRSISEQLKNNSREVIGFTLSVPLFNRFQTRNQVRGARLNIENRTLELDNVKLALFKEIQQAYQSAVAAQAKFSSSSVALDASQESFKYAQERYDIGKSTVFEFADAQTKLLSSRSDQIQAKYDFLFRAKILDFYQGMPIDIK